MGDFQRQNKVIMVLMPNYCHVHVFSKQAVSFDDHYLSSLLMAWYRSLTSLKKNVYVYTYMMADLGTPAAGAMTPNPAAPGGGKQPLVYICGGTSMKRKHLSVDVGLCRVY